MNLKKIMENNPKSNEKSQEKKDINKPVHENLLGNPALLSPQMPGLNKVINIEQTKIPA